VKPYEEMTQWELWEAMQDAGEMMHKAGKGYKQAVI